MHDWTCCQPTGQCTQATGCPAGGACHSRHGCKDTQCPGHPGVLAGRDLPAPTEPLFATRAEWRAHALLYWCAAMLTAVMWLGIGAMLDRPLMPAQPECMEPISDHNHQACAQLAQWQTDRGLK